MYRPGAATSGFAKPSSVWPQADHGAGLSSYRSVVPPRSIAPTAITNGSFPGAYGPPPGPWASPALAAAAAPAEIDRADGHPERIVPRRVRNAARAIGLAVVAGGGDDEHVVEPEL